MATAKKEVPALAEDDVGLLLERIGVAEKYRSGRLLCSVCDERIQAGHLAAVRLTGESYRFSCDQLDCLETFHGAS